MAQKDNMINLVRTVTASHHAYWKDQRAACLSYRDIYSSMFWAGKKISDDAVRVETPDAYSFIEGYISALFSKSPSIEISSDISVPDAEPIIAQKVVNRFLNDQRNAFEDATRQALLYPCSFLKVAPVESASMLDRVTVRALPPWEVVVDRDATSWETQRFVGHLYSMPYLEAKSRFGTRKKITPTAKSSFLDSKSNREAYQLPDEYLYIEVLELYDLVNDKLIFWSPNHDNGASILEIETIPVRTFNEQPLAPIVPLYYSRTPDKPLNGLSSMARMYDMFYEKNQRRTFWASAVRKDGRQWLAKRGALDEEAQAKLASGQDGVVIEVDEERLGDILFPIPAGNVSSNDTAYMNYIEQDLARGSMVAPFARGEASNITATEVTALAQYTASEIGKYARERDQAIERCAMIYLRVLSFMIAEGEKDVIRIDKEAKVVTATDLEGKWLIRAVDQGNDPITKAMKRKQLENAIPTLVGLGVDKTLLAKALIDSYDLPATLYPAPPAPPVQEAPAAPPVPTEEPAGPDTMPTAVLPNVRL